MQCQRPGFKLLRFAYLLLDMIMVLISPMYILLFVVGVISLMDQHNQFNRFMRMLDTNSYVVEAEVEIPMDEGKVHLQYFTSDGEEHMAYLDVRYNPRPVLESLYAGQQVEIRCPEPSFEGNAVLEEYYPAVRESHDYARDPLIVMGIGWLLIIFYPQFLYEPYNGTVIQKIVNDRLAKR